MVKRIIRKFLGLTGYRLVSVDQKLIFGSPDYYNYLRSRELGRSVTFNDEAIPWITYPALEYLEQFDLKSFSIFEYGSGGSSIWFADRCARVTSVESNREWVDHVRSFGRDNVKVIFKDEAEYAECLDEVNEKFDLISIDALRRYDCAVIASRYLNKDGVILFDNSDRHQDACRSLREKGFLQVDFKGFGPINKYTWTTSLFFSSLKNLPSHGDIPSLSRGNEREFRDFA